ncbi:hypothetical protein C8R44DRAFT_240238 [Mycena epipterygia]|nr:hypothetical protein C8R44DRAFT_240238 [Mycena epipterygia]
MARVLLFVWIGALCITESDRVAWYDPPTRSISSSRAWSATRARSIWGPSHLRGRNPPRIQDTSSRRVIAGLLEPPCCASSLEYPLRSGVELRDARDMMRLSAAARALALLQAFCGSEGGVADGRFITTARPHASSARHGPLAPSFQSSHLITYG